MDDHLSPMTVRRWSNEAYLKYSEKKNRSEDRLDINEALMNPLERRYKYDESGCKFQARFLKTLEVHKYDKHGILEGKDSIFRLGDEIETVQWRN